MPKVTSEGHHTWLKEGVISACSDDYEEFATILRDLEKWAVEDGETFTRSEVIATLETVIKEGYAQAYLLSPHQVRNVDFTEDRLDELWFYVTERGKALAIAVQESHG